MRDIDRLQIVSMIGRAWEQAGVSVKCEVCAQQDWALVTGQNTDGAALPLRGGDVVDHAQCFLVYAMTCKNCGNVRMMAKTRIEELAGVERTAETS